MGCEGMEETRVVAREEGDNMDKSALKRVIKVENSQVLWPTEPEDQFIRTKIIKLLLQALIAKNIWEAMEYLMAARGLLRIIRKRQEVMKCEPYISGHNKR